ncbi:hypothetical protein [Lutimonas zeaxanthinifaciens]|uniref:hypothetical protein n=1 Tax=Lutimonas zeaxanthinifaciens TaxID=3060215 RepID=UPI00265D3620|nr:hypothetical protein [Lutimonas sp. YSD2104]WKK65660.1 hypothetical protein QZH61_13855 [Lutimonas sp. YSD2104]
MKNFISRFKLIPILAVALFFLTSCAQALPVQECIEADSYGFFGGLWHGIIAPFSFVASLFLDNVALYAVNNNGGWYDFGFVLGAGILFGGSGKAS